MARKAKSNQRLKRDRTRKKASKSDASFSYRHLKFQNYAMKRCLFHEASIAG